MRAGQEEGGSDARPPRGGRQAAARPLLSGTPTLLSPDGTPHIQQHVLAVVHNHTVYNLMPRACREAHYLAICGEAVRPLTLL